MSQAIMSRVVNASIRNANCKLSRATTLEFVIDKGALVLKQFEINYAFQEKSTFTSKTMWHEILITNQSISSMYVIKAMSTMPFVEHTDLWNFFLDCTLPWISSLDFF